MTAAMASGRVARLPLWRPRVFLTILGFSSAVTFAGGMACLVVHLGSDEVEHILAPAAAMMFVSGLVQLRLTLSAWRERHAVRPNTPPLHLRFWQSLVVGAFAAYLAALAVGPVPYIGCAWAATIVVWYTLLLLPLAAAPRALEKWRQWSQGRAARRLNWLVCATILLALCGEFGLRMQRIAAQLDWSTAAPSGTNETSIDSVSGGSTPDLAAGRMSRLDADHFRVAVLGDEAVLGSAKRDGYLERLQQQFSGLKIVPITMPRPWSRRGEQELNARLVACQPDLLLTVLSVCEDLERPAPSTNWFDWRQLELMQRFAGPSNKSDADSGPRQQAVALGDFESFLQALAPQLLACRTPIDSGMRARWQQTFGSLDSLLKTCRKQGIPTALVLVPGEFQVNRTLCETLVRRAGGTSEQFDVELPQRRWSGFAEHRNLPVLDLLPHLRLCGKSPYERNATTWNEQGDTTAAAAIGGWLQSRYRGQLALAAQLSSAP